MRTKHILTALVLPALFAACTADDFNEPITGNGVADRALLSEDFKLYAGGADTRFSAGEGSGLEFSYEVGDSIGGAIIDEYQGNDVYDVVPYISTNHPFVLDANGEWTINHTMVEGTYLFYYPYNQQNHARGPIQYSIPTIQDLSDAEGNFDPKAAIEKYNMGIGTQFLDKEDLSANLQLVNIFGYAKIQLTLDNRYAGGNVDKIVLQAKGTSKFALNGQIDNEIHDKLFNKLETSAKDFQEGLKNYTETANFCLASGTYYDPELNTPSTVIVAKAPEGTALEVDGQNNKTFETYIVMPAAAYQDIDILLYTTNGDVYHTGETDFTIVRNSVKALEYNLTKSDVVPYVVTSEADWNDYVALLKKNQNSEDGTPATFIIASEDFAISNDTKFPTNGAEIVVESDLKVAGDNVTIKNVTVKGTVTVEEGAKLTTDGTFGATTVENNGTLVVTPAYDENKKVINYDELTTVVNNAALEVAEEAVASFALQNDIDVKTAALAHGTVTVNGELALTTGSYNDGEITIAATGQLSGEFTNSQSTREGGEYIYPTTVADEKDIKARFTPSITNNGTILATGAVVNNADIENAKGAEISCSKTASGAEFTNGGTINLKDGSRMLITENKDGEVILEKLDQTNWSIEKGQGIVAYSTSATDTSIDFTKNGKGITKLYVNGNLTITKYGNLKNIVVVADATLTVPAAATLAEMTVEEGAEATIVATPAKTGDPAATTIGSLIVEEDAVLNVNDPNELTATSVANEGVIYVGGKFTTDTKEENAGDGTFRTTSSTGSINFGDAAGSEAEQDYINALQAMVQARVSQGALTTWDDVTEKVLENGTWTTGSWATLATAAMNAYNAWAEPEAKYTDIQKFIDEVFEKDERTENILNEYKTIGANGMASVIAEQIPDNEWIDNSGVRVYTKATKDVKFAAIADGSNNIMVNDFATKVNAIDENEVKVYEASETLTADEAAARNRAIWLSLKDVEGDDVKEAWIPACSYIGTYEGATEYDIMALMNKFKTTDTDVWNEDITENNLKTDTGFIKAFKALYNAYYDETIPAADRREIDEATLESYADEVLGENWTYKSGQLATLYNAVVTPAP